MQPEQDQQAAEALQASQTYLGQWNHLVSTTNWEKGRIICQWREALIASDCPAQQYSDEAWSRYVGNVSGQHVGRLRRVYSRFADVRETFPGLYWSHFQAALDFDDAEMWLEGAVQNGWSVSQMRHQRWQALGGLAAEEPADDEIVSAEWDEDYGPIAAPDIGQVRDPQGPGSGTSSTAPSDDETAADFPGRPTQADSSQQDAATGMQPSEQLHVRPFENLAELPDDLTEAFEAFKLAILHHKLSGWQEVSRQDVLATLAALRQLALSDG